MVGEVYSSTCLAIADSFGDQQATCSCGGHGDKIHKHDFIRDASFSAAKSAVLALKKRNSIPNSRFKQSTC